MKPRHTWIVTASCLALLCGAMAWITRSMLHMEREQTRMAGDAAIQEMARLALWRMESVARDVVIGESARPPEQYRPFAEPDVVLDNKTHTAVNAGDLLTLSPVLREPPEYVLLHFEMDATGALRSPQVPRGRDLLTCQSIGYPPEDSLETASRQLQVLSGILDKGGNAAPITALRASLAVPPRLIGNRALLWSGNGEPVPPNGNPPLLADNQADAVKVQKAEKSPFNNYAQQSSVWKPEQVKMQQTDLNEFEAQSRAGMVKSGIEKSGKRANTLEELKGKETANAASKKKEESKPATKEPPSVQQQAVSAVEEPARTPSSPPALSDFRPFWIGEALVLTRRVSQGSREWIQGAWLDWGKLRGELLSAVQDRFPEARIEPAREVPEQGAHLLASLPVQLIPGAVEFAPPPFWSPLKVSLGIAWLCVLLAVAAVALVLRGMMALSERRASFVSSVTHELRTPLATFKLYSEMLADGMVREEAKRQQYLETLTSEADRLGHLVENVLSYSRIERGKGPAALSAVPVSELIRRVEPRLNQRALIAGMDFAVTAAPDVSTLALRTDAGAVEQILCNLVDNACKYGHREGTPGFVELMVTRERRRVCFTVRDRGPGIDRREEKKLFLPFHKSAREAAHSQPGVGLGLALCRRLAGELRGTLGIDHTWRQGAAFVLKLPV